MKLCKRSFDTYPPEIQSALRSAAIETPTTYDLAAEDFAQIIASHRPPAAPQITPATGQPVAAPAATGCACANPLPEHGLGQRVAQGFVGLAKATLGIEQADSGMVARRRLKCGDCQHRKAGFCAICGCLLLAKTTLAAEVCPADRW